MKLLVLGATGGTGQEIVRQAIERGHSVTAFVRLPDRLNPFKDRITIKQGDLLNSVELEQAIRGHDAVLSALGPRVPISKADANLLQRFAVAFRTEGQTLYGEISRARGTSAALRFQYFARECGRLHAQGSGESLVNRQDRGNLQLIRIDRGTN